MSEPITTECPFCKTRELLKQAEQIIDSAPQINSDHYDDVMTELMNQISNTYSYFMCFCPDMPVEQK